MLQKKIKNFVKKELSGWQSVEIVIYAISVLLIFYNAFVLKDSPIAVISAFCGITYTIIAGKGKLSCYLFGLTGSGFYAYLSFVNCVYGNFALYLFYYIPMQLFGIINWKKHLKTATNEIYKTDLKNKQYLILSSILLCMVFVTGLFYLKDSHPIFDGITTALSIVGMYLTVKRCIEQWFIWGIVNLLTAVIWIKLIIAGEKVYSTAIMWIIYIFLSVYFYREWKKEL